MMMMKIQNKVLIIIRIYRMIQLKFHSNMMIKVLKVPQNKKRHQ